MEIVTRPSCPTAKAHHPSDLKHLSVLRYLVFQVRGEVSLSENSRINIYFWSASQWNKLHSTHRFNSHFDPIWQVAQCAGPLRPNIGHSRGTVESELIANKPGMERRKSFPSQGNKNKDAVAKNDNAFQAKIREIFNEFFNIIESIKFLLIENNDCLN